MNPTKLTSQPPSVPQVRKISQFTSRFTLRGARWLRLLVCCIGLSSVLTSAQCLPDVEYLVTDQVLQLELPFLMNVKHTPDRLGWRDQRKWQMSSEKIRKLNPRQLKFVQTSSILHPYPTSLRNRLLTYTGSCFCLPSILLLVA